MRQRGSIVVPLLGLIAAMALMTAAVTRDSLQRRQEVRRTHMRAVARNLAEAGIVAGRLGRNVPAGLAGPTLDRFQGSVRLKRSPLPGGRHRLISTAVLRDSGGDSMRYVIEVTLARGSDGRPPPRVVSWDERQLFP